MQIKNSIKIIEVIIEKNTDFYKNNRNVTRKKIMFSIKSTELVIEKKSGSIKSAEIVIENGKFL